MNGWQILITICISIITAAITTKFAITKYTITKWWDEKEKVYSRIIEDLANYQNSVYKWQDFYWGILERKGIFESQEQNNILKNIKELREPLRIMAMKEAFYINYDTLKALETLLNMTNDLTGDDPLHDISETIKLIKKCTSDIVKFAKKDLKIE
jgi:hypothetical protein